MRARNQPVFLLWLGLAAGCATPAQRAEPASDRVLEELVTLERAALDRWITLNPDGYLELYAPEVTYFDPTTERRISGRDTMRSRLAPMRTMTAPFTEPRYELIDPRVQAHGDVAVLTFNVVNYGKVDGAERELGRWNSTEVYRRTDRAWRIIHAHWSRTQPQPPAPGTT
jgi:uncharacterized protein (TIGR02246 family)